MISTSDDLYNVMFSKSRSSRPVITMSFNKTSATPATTFSTNTTIDHEANNYILYILSSLLCLFVLTTILITFFVICQLKHCRKRKEQIIAIPTSSFTANPITMEPIYETISLTSVVENHFINGAEPVVAPTHITMSENDAIFLKIKVTHGQSRLQLQ